MVSFQNIKPIRKELIEASTLLASPVALKPLNDVGLQNKITDKNLHRPGLALAGYVELFTYDRVQVFGNTETKYLSSLGMEERIATIKRICEFPIPCVIITNSNKLDQELVDIFTTSNVCLFETSIETTRAFALLSDFLSDQFSLQATVHGSFVDVYGVGILFVGRSAIGKSEIALDLVERGHRLVADDVVMLTRTKESVIMGTGTNLVQHFMEIRGLGIIDVRQMFGIRAIRFQKRLEIVVELEDWSETAEYNRLGLDDEPCELLGININNVKLPIYPGKNITVIAEVIALNYLLKTYGYNAAEVFADKLKKAIEKKNSGSVEDRIISYFQGDIE